MCRLRGARYAAGRAALRQLRGGPTSDKEEERMATGLGAYKLDPREGEALWFFGGLATVKASAEQTGGKFSISEQVFPMGMATPLHSQPDDETFYVLAGDLTFYLEDGQPLTASTGSFVHLPAGTVHAYQVDSETARVLNVTTPQHEGFFHAAGEPARERILPPQAPPDMDKLMAAANEYGVEILGPPPGAKG
jgi:quercetin dioxygenase-like cupin family protein